MRLVTATFQHYKSLTSVTLDKLGPLTALVGQNASGKSNTIDALRFLRDMTSGGLDHAFSLRNGITLVRQQSKTKPFKIQLSLTLLDDDNHEHSYEISIASQRAGNFLIESERIVWHGSEWLFEKDDSGNTTPVETIRQLTAYRNAEGSITVNGEQQRHRLGGDVVALGVVTTAHWIALGGPIASFLSQLRFSSIFPNTLKLPAKPDTDHILKETGENWASVLKALKRTASGRTALARIIEMMQRVLPTLEDVTVKTVGGYLVPKFRFRGETGEHDFDPMQLSDGSLRIFGILLALYQTPAPVFLLVEEPEQTVHPAVLAMLAEAFREASERTQILVTSHSPHLIDCFRPEEVRVVTMDSDGTHVSTIKRTQIESVKRSLMTLEELMAAEGLLPELA